MPANFIWRGCAWAYAAGVGAFAIGLAIMFVIGAFETEQIRIGEIPVILGSYVMFVAFAAFAGAVMAVPLMALAHGINLVFRPSRDAVTWWLPPLILGVVGFLIVGSLFYALAGAALGLAFWYGLQPR